MASGIPTRRSRRADENAPPTLISTRSRSAVPTLGGVPKPSTSTSIPLSKRALSAQSALPSTSGTKDAKLRGESSKLDAKSDGGKTDAKRRAALGEIQSSKNADKAPVRERKPLRSTAVAQPAPVPAARRLTRASDAKPQAAERKPAAARRAVLPYKDTRAEEEPVAKRRRTSTPAVEEEEEREVVLSSGSKGVSLRSPKPESRPKDYGWTDLDAEDEDDPSMVSEYVVDAFNYMLDIEKKTTANPDYMDKQDELEWPMRVILMDWLIEVHNKFRLLPETLFIATNLIDRFLSARVVSLVKLQLVGLTALFVAAKYEEVICPSITHFLHMTDGGYSVDEILKAERYLLSVLDFDLSYPNPLHFLRRVSKADAYDVQTRTVAKYFIEAACVDHALLPYTPSMLAAAGMWLARYCLERGEWTPNLVHYSSYSEDELLPCAQAMLNFVLDPNFDETSSFYKKYAAKKHLKASHFVRDWAVNRWPDSAKGRCVRGTELYDDLSDEVRTP
ncbi:G2/mitotic-specific cyclin [Cryptotrichosporon argae]